VISKIKKYGIRDYRGGGRSSARETAMRVAAGAVARKVLTEKIGKDAIVRAAVVQVGPHKINRENWDWDQVDQNPFWCPDAKAVETWAEYLDGQRKNGSSAGAIMMSINATKAVEIGAGFDAVEWGGEQNADEITKDGFQSNNAGGILGGISSGQDIVCRVAFKPTSSILTPVKTIDKDGNETDIITKGRHDPCVGLRGTPVCEAMMAVVLADHYLRHKAQCL